jgi:DNA-binding IclR family transcriptional regulator
VAKRAAAVQAASSPAAAAVAPPSARGAVVPAAARTMALFEIFAREKRELTKSEVARLLDLPESSSSDLLNTLHDLGYVSRTPTTKRFYPTARLLSVAREVSENNALADFGAEATSLLAQKSGETACCAVLADDRIKVVAVAQGGYRLRYVIEVGDTFTIHATALGKALLSGVSDTEMHRILRLKPLAQLTGNTKTEPRLLEKDVRAGRERGWQNAVDEGTMGVSSLAIVGRVGDDNVGLGIIGPTERVAPNGDELTACLIGVGRTVFGA